MRVPKSDSRLLVSGLRANGFRVLTVCGFKGVEFRGLGFKGRFRGLMFGVWAGFLRSKTSEDKTKP